VLPRRAANIGPAHARGPGGKSQALASTHLRQLDPLESPALALTPEEAGFQSKDRPFPLNDPTWLSISREQSLD